MCCHAAKLGLQYQRLNIHADIASVESGRLEIVERAFRLDEAISEIARASEIRCRDKGLRFVLAADTQSRQLVLGDRARLTQVLENLLANVSETKHAQGQAVNTRP